MPLERATLANRWPCTAKRYPYGCVLARPLESVSYHMRFRITATSDNVPDIPGLVRERGINSQSIVDPERSWLRTYPRDEWAAQWVAASKPDAVREVLPNGAFRYTSYAEFAYLELSDLGALLALIEEYGVVIVNRTGVGSASYEIEFYDDYRE